MQQQTETLTAELAQQPGLNNVVTTFRPHTPQLLLKMDRDKVEAFGVPLSDVNQTMQMYLGSSGPGYFNDFGRTWQVTLQASGEFRNNVDDIGQLQVRNNKGQMVPLGVLINLIPQDGPLSLQRYNLHSAASITGNLAQGVSSGEAISNIEATAERTRQPGMGTEWTELMFLQIRAGNTALFVFALAVLCVFLALAALYESWTMPLAVILVVPMCLLCAWRECGPRRTRSTSSCRSAWWSWSGWRARTPSWSSSSPSNCTGAASRGPRPPSKRPGCGCGPSR